MKGRREGTLRAAGEAARILARFPLERRTSFDIVRAVTELGFPIIFRPTKDLLGATVTVGDDSTGILVTTKRSLAIQRFTLAHELGHIRLGHEMRVHLLDEQGNMLVPGGTNPEEEKAADTFASGLLAARQLISRVAKKQNWDVSNLGGPATIYQLSLRLGISFQAACWALAGTKMISIESAKRIAAETTVNELKTALVSPYSLSDPWADVWAISERDVGTFLECGPNDLFVAAVRDNSSAGFLWDLEDSARDFEVIAEKTHFENTYGADNSRQILLRTNTPGSHRLALEHKRPWSDQRLSGFEISIANFGKEAAGFPRYLKETLLLAR